VGDGFQGVFHAHRPQGGLLQRQKQPHGRQKWAIQISSGRINKNKKAPAAKPLRLGSSATPMRGFFISPA
jgi:hypothetical protein